MNCFRVNLFAFLNSKVMSAYFKKLEVKVLSSQLSNNNNVLRMSPVFRWKNMFFLLYFPHFHQEKVITAILIEM